MAADVLSKLNPLIQINKYPYRLSTDNALELIEEYDIVLDGTDNFSSRYMINDACAILKKPLVFASMYKFEGQLSVFHLTDNSQTYRCVFPEPPSEETVPNCSETGIIGVLPGIIGSLQASEAIKLITGIGEPLDGKLICYNNLNQNWLTLTVKRNEDIVNKFKLSREEFKKKTYEESNCINESINLVNDITANMLLEEPNKYRIIDIREYHESPRLEFDHAERIPLSSISKEHVKTNSDKPTVIVCQRGIRSKRLIEEVLAAYPNINNLYNLEGGILSLVTIKNKAQNL
jgi:adenylyltransferase/sulfurtransferase